MQRYEQGISVAIATFNGGPYLRQQLDSILSQSMQPVDIVISDDGSKDDTLTILAEYQKAHDFIKVIHNPLSGINNNFINAVDACRAEWIAFCDQDDIWDSDKLKLLYSQCENTQIVYSRSQLVDGNGEPLPCRAEDYLGFGRYKTGTICPLYFFSSNCISGHAMMVRRQTIDEALPVPEGILFDQWFSLVAACKGQIKFLDIPLTLHRIHSSNSHNNKALRSQRKDNKKALPKTQRFLFKRDKTLRLLERVKHFEANLSEEDKRIIGKYRDHCEQNYKSVIDLEFFIFLISVRNQLFSCKPFKKVLQESLGQNYYRILDKLLSR